MMTTTTMEDYDWAPVSATVGRFVREHLERYWVAARVEPGAGRGAPACWVPAESECEIDATFVWDEIESLGGEPLHLDTQVDWHRTPRLVGAVAHELSHATHSHGFPPAGTSRLVHETWVALEESRAERLFIQEKPVFRSFIRTAIDDIVRPTMMTNPEKMGAFAYASVAALLLARVDSGLFSPGTFDELEKLIRERLTDDIYDTLRKLWGEFHATDDGDIASQVAIAVRWVEALKPLLDKESDEIREQIEKMLKELGEGEGEGEGSPSHHPGTSSESKSESDDAGFGDMNDAVRDGVVSEAIDAEDELADEQAEAEARDREATSTSTRTGKKRWGKVFARGSQGQPAPSDYPDALRITWEPVPDPVRAAANRLAKMMERASFRDRETTKVTSAVPPGRLNGRARMERSIARKRGVPSTAEPWKSTKRKHVDSPAITVGIMLDVSGSMRSVQEPAVRLGWAIAHSVYRIQGTTAMVSFGDGVTPLLYAHDRPNQIPTVRVDGSGEVFEHGFHALNSQLNFFPGTGPRVLVVLSDGHYVWSKHEAFNRTIMPRLAADGVKIVVISPSGRITNREHYPKSAELVTMNGRPDFDEMVTLVGRAIVKQLERG